MAFYKRRAHALRAEAYRSMVRVDMADGDYSSAFALVGWVERSEIHHKPRLCAMGFASLCPSYG
jgi:hypothetical protein